MSQVYEIDGAEFSTLDEFFAEFTRKVIPGAEWGRNLDAFNDVLFGGFGTPEGGFTLVWKNSSLSRIRLGYPETARHWRRALATRGRLSRGDDFRKQLQAAEREEGPTLFDQLVSIIENHGQGASLSGKPSEVKLVLA